MEKAALPASNIVSPPLCAHVKGRGFSGKTTAIAQCENRDWIDPPTYAGTRRHLDHGA